MAKNRRKKSKKTNKTNSRKTRFSIGIGGLLLGFVVLGGVYFNNTMPEPFSAESTSKNAQNGQLLFNKNCLVCHGPGAIGEDPSQPKGGVKSNGVYLAPALNGTGHAWHHSSKDLLNTIRNGSLAKESPMKGFKGRLSGEEIAAILQYIQSLWPEEVRKSYGL